MFFDTRLCTLPPKDTIIVVIDWIAPGAYECTSSNAPSITNVLPSRILTFTSPFTPGDRLVIGDVTTVVMSV